MNLVVRKLHAKYFKMLSHYNIALVHHSRQIYSQKHNKSIASYSNLLSYKVHYQFSNEQQKNRKALAEEKFKQKTEDMLKQTPEVNEQDQTSYSKSQNKLTKYLMGISVIALLAVYAMMEIQGIRAQKRLDKSVTGMTKVSSSGKANIGGPWTLVDTKGKKFGSSDLDGSYYLIYFGFTNCPDICPNSLLKLSKAIQKIRKMPQYQYLNLKTVFVSVDPDRDTPQKIEKFLSYFDKSFIGVTGKSNNDQQLRQCMKKFKIYASKIQFEDQDTVIKGRKAYTIDHTILTYLMSDSNQYLAHLGANLGEHQLAKTIIQKILVNQHQKMKVLRAT